MYDFPYCMFIHMWCAYWKLCTKKREIWVHESHSKFVILKTVYVFKATLNKRIVWGFFGHFQPSNGFKMRQTKTLKMKTTIDQIKTQWLGSSPFLIENTMHFQSVWETLQATHYVIVERRASLKLLKVNSLVLLLQCINRHKPKTLAVHHI